MLDVGVGQYNKVTVHGGCSCLEHAYPCSSKCNGVCFDDLRLKGVDIDLLVHSGD